MDKGTTLNFKKGSCIFAAEDSSSDPVYIIQSGEVELQYNDQVRAHYSRIAGEGDIIGFISSLSKRPRINSAIALSKVTALELSSDNFLTLLSRNHDIALKVIRIFAKALTFYNETLFSRSGNRQSSSNPEQLLKLARFYASEDPDIANYIYARFLEKYPDNENHTDAEEERRALNTKDLSFPDQPGLKSGRLTMLPGQVVFCEQEQGDTLYVILSGRVEIIKVKDNSSVLLSILHEGDVFGELAIASNRPRNATAISADQTILLPVTQDSLKSLMERKPVILQKIFTSICERIWFTALRSELHLYALPLTRVYTFLVNKLQEDRIELKRRHSHVFDFDMKTLLKMTGLRSIKPSDPVFQPFISDPNIFMNFGQITVNDVSELVARTRQYKRQDLLKRTD